MSYDMQTQLHLLLADVKPPACTQCIAARKWHPSIANSVPYIRHANRRTLPYVSLFPPPLPPPRSFSPPGSHLGAGSGPGLMIPHHAHSASASLLTPHG